MEPESSSPKRARADEPYGLPSPKRNCLDTGLPHSTAEVSTPSTPFDDMDDLYDTPKKSPDKSAPVPPTNPPTDAKPIVSLKSPEIKKTFQLPGLGQSLNAPEQDNSIPPEDAGSFDERQHTVEVPSEDTDKVNGSPEPRAEQNADDSHHHESASLPVPDQGGHTLAPEGQEDTDGAQNKSSIVFAHATTSEPAARVEAQPTTAPAKIAGEVGLASSILEAPANIDVASLSKDLPPVAVNNTKTVSGPQPATVEQPEPKAFEDPPEPPSVCDLDHERTAAPDQSGEIMKDTTGANKTDEQPEFEMDSSPLESSTSDSSSDSSSSEDSDGYELLSPEEQARRLMLEGMGSDDEGTGKSGSGRLSGPLRTTNEKPDEFVPKPDLIVTGDMKIQELGDIECLVENEAVIKGKTSGEYQVLETGSILCLGDRTVIGVIADTWGRVQQPYYSVRFTNAAAITNAGISKSTDIFYVESHSTTVFTQPLKAYKGSDASNLHDEEVGDDEMEFSDDEKEAEHKRRLKQAKQARREGRPADGDGISRGPGRGRGDRGRPRGRGGRPMQERSAYDAGAPISYDDMEVDGPYNPLARPTNLHEMMGRNEAPVEPIVNGNSSHRGARGARPTGERGRGRGRGDRGRGDRDRRGGQSHEGYGSAGHGSPTYPYWTEAAPAQTPPAYGYPLQQSPYAPSQGASQQGYMPHYPATPPQASFNYSSYQQQSPSHFQHQAFQNQPQQPNIPPGAFVNPAFFSQSQERNQYPAADPRSPK